MKAISEKWTCKGEVCGECGVIHRSYWAAKAHCDRHAGSIRAEYPVSCFNRPYSDRFPYPLNEAAQAMEAELNSRD